MPTRKLGSWFRTVVLATVLIRAPAAAAGATHKAHFWFVQIADTHFGVLNNDARARRVVDDINRLPMKIEFVVHTGDFFADNILATSVVNVATSILSQLRVPLHSLPGNHDILRGKLAATVDVYTNRIGPLCSRTESHGVVFLFLDTEPLRRGFAIQGYEPLAWLKEQLAAAGRKPVIVCQHAPAVEDFYDNKMHPGWPPEVRARWNGLLNSANVQGVLAGHFHRDELYWEGKVPVYVCSAVAAFWGRQGSYRIYEYRDGKLGYRTRYLEESASSGTIRKARTRSSSAGVTPMESR